MSRSGSRYPSAFGHTPSYRSYVRGGLEPSSGVGYNVHLPLGSGGYSGVSVFGNSPDAVLGAGGAMGASGIGSGIGIADSFGSGIGSSLGSSILPTSSLGSGNFSSSSDRREVSSYSSYSNSALDGGRPRVEYRTDNTLRASNIGASGIPHSTYKHSGATFSSDQPWKNRVDNFAYDI